MGFCRRFGHRTAVIGNRFYIDGGYINWNPLSQNPLNCTRQLLRKFRPYRLPSIDINLYHDLLYSDHLELSELAPQIKEGLTKNSSVHSVAGGTLWAGTVNKVFYAIGGYFTDEALTNFVT